MPKLSVIIPYVNEYPQVMFTVRNIAEDLIGRVDFEIILIDNWCAEVEQGQKRIPDKGHAHFIGKDNKVHGIYRNTKGMTPKESHLKVLAKGLPWLKYITYNDKLSHWNAKRVGILASDGDILWFCDSHCIVGRDSVFNMFQHYINNLEELDGSIHLPLTYHILESKRLVYSMKADPRIGQYHYTFCGLNPKKVDEVHEVPCMSTCGMMISRELYDLTGGWPAELGIYGGGENFINYTLSVLGKKKWIYPHGTLHHHADRRGYHWNSGDFARNHQIATYIFGGEEVVRRLANNQRGRQHVLQEMLIENIEQHRHQRKVIRERQVCSIDEWVKGWRSKT